MSSFDAVPLMPQKVPPTSVHTTPRRIRLRRCSSLSGNSSVIEQSSPFSDETKGLSLCLCVSQRHVILQRNVTLGGKRVCLPGKTGTIPCVLSFFLNNDSTGRAPLLSRERKPAIARPRIARRNHGIRRHHHSTQAGLPHPRPIACTRQRARRLRGGIRDPRPRGLRHHLRAAPSGFGRPRHVDLVRRQQQVLLHCLQDAARG